MIAGNGHQTSQPGVDWQVLRTAAAEMTKCSHAPYSGLTVGAAGLTDNGLIVHGCNVENASYGLTLCAECGLVSDYYRIAAPGLRAVSVVDGAGELLLPCGRCRQLLFEVGGSELLIDAPGGPLEIQELLPAAFGPESLPTTGGMRGGNERG